MEFSKALKLVGLAEGHWTNDPDDSGGLTACGLARNKNPDLKIWTIIDKYLERGLSLSEIEKICRADPEFMAFVEAVYKAKYWNTAHCPDLAPLLRYPVFSCSVNCGYKWAIRLLQKAAGVTADGIFGKTTKALCSVQVPEKLCERFYQYWTAYYKALVKHNPNQEKYLKGWLNRIEDVKLNND